ncbi:MAG TPA: acyl-CoA dehydrogenase family protein [Thermoanaerobaculia bacterium]|jgi:alkylation response protein AidB-like acyl-CoA dehydrogenase|nr:acyl-CoA dehydrogenase family protein [Thermoanaerobaculia bacterium]
MRIELSPEQRALRSDVRAFVQQEIAPHAGQWDRDEVTPRGIVDKLVERGWLGSMVPAEHGGKGLDMISYGVLTEEIGRGCSSIRSLLTVHDMVCRGILRWGSQGQKESWLPRLARGEILGAFALSEPDAGSDAMSIQTKAVEVDGGYALDGTKKWITYGQIADLYLLFAKLDGKPTAFLVERETPGLTVMPLRGIQGTRASMLAELKLEGARTENMVGRPGFGVSHVVGAALDQGRYSVACGSVGIAQACLDASLAYARERQQFGQPLFEHQLVRAMLSDMITNVRAARLLCMRAGYLRDTGDPGAIAETSIAKYFASTTANRAAADAVQIHGANGCHEDFPVSRYFRDAKVMEIIEGSTQIQQSTIARFELEEL